MAAEQEFWESKFWIMDLALKAWFSEAPTALVKNQWDMWMPLQIRLRCFKIGTQTEDTWHVHNIVTKPTSPWFCWHVPRWLPIFSSLLLRPVCVAGVNALIQNIFVKGLFFFFLNSVSCLTYWTSEILFVILVESMWDNQRYTTKANYHTALQSRTILSSKRVYVYDWEPCDKLEGYTIIYTWR